MNKFLFAIIPFILLLAACGSSPTPGAVAARPVQVTPTTAAPVTPGGQEVPQATQIPADFVKIPGGIFTMGSPSYEEDRDSDEKEHQVTVSSFHLNKHEVTVSEFRSFVNVTRYKTTAETGGGGLIFEKGDWVQKADANWRNPYFRQEDTHPVVFVSWYDAVQYCNWRSRQEGLTPAYTINGTNITWNWNANGYRLPTEAEWEYACRAGTTTAYSTGNSLSLRQANYDNTIGKTTAVGSYAANAWGLFDMHGNVWEWCWDLYGDYPNGVQVDPTGANSGPGRVFRGGCWSTGTWSVRSASRNYVDTSWRRAAGISNDVGFRLARNAQ